jgi:hypothetical protein
MTRDAEYVGQYLAYSGSESLKGRVVRRTRMVSQVNFLARSQQLKPY